MEKRGKELEREIYEWKKRADSLSVDLEETQKSCRDAAAELYRVKVKLK